MKKKIIWISLAVILTLVITLTVVLLVKKTDEPIIISKNGKIDDWQYSPSEYEESKTRGIGSIFNSGSKGISMDSAMMSTEGMLADTTIGFSVGGAKDVENFRENIKNGYFPISTDITYNGLFYDYTFNTGKKNESKDLFSPSYSTAISKDPVSNENEYYMTVGLNSNIKESDFQRKKLNLQK